MDSSQLYKYTRCLPRMLCSFFNFSVPNITLVVVDSCDIRTNTEIQRMQNYSNAK
jgi:hypothetical protein